MMKVSVIIPYTDRDMDLLPRAMSSAERQTVAPHEIIPVHDKDYRGIPWARNTGFAKATGDLIIPLDCDDWIDPMYIEETMKLMTPEIGIVSTYFMYHGKNEGTILVGPEQTYESELQSNNITVCSLVRRECIEKAGPWDHNLRGWEDWDMWLRILKLGWRHAVVKKVLFHYRNHDSGVCAWADQPENKKKLHWYLAAKHSGFAENRNKGRKWSGI
jgi:glycosyltransferase involved in cell wall biosynthesis